MKHRPPLRREPGAGPAVRLVFALLLSFGVVAALGTMAQAATDGLTISDPWVRTVLPSQPAAGYFTLSNETAKPHALVRASSPACGMLMLHQSSSENGTEKMVMVKSIDVPAHGKVEFAPGGYHLMCMSPSKDVMPGHFIPITLHFRDGHAVTVKFPVRGAKGE